MVGSHSLIAEQIQGVVSLHQMLAVAVTVHPVIVMPAKVSVKKAILPWGLRPSRRGNRRTIRCHLLISMLDFNFGWTSRANPNPNPKHYAKQWFRAKALMV